MYILPFKNMINDLCQANQSSSSMLVQSLTTPFHDLVNAMHKVPLSSSPWSPVAPESAGNSSLHRVIDGLSQDPLYPCTSPSDPASRWIDDTGGTPLDGIIGDLGSVNLSESPPVRGPVNLVQSALVHPPSTGSFEALVQYCLELYQPTHGEQDSEGSHDCSLNSDFKPELDRDIPIWTHLPLDNEDQEQAAIPREHIAS